jgi:hypothetical protein
MTSIISMGKATGCPGNRPGPIFIAVMEECEKVAITPPKMEKDLRAVEFALSCLPRAPCRPVLRIGAWQGRRADVPTHSRSSTADVLLSSYLASSSHTATHFDHLNDAGVELGCAGRWRVADGRSRSRLIIADESESKEPSIWSGKGWYSGTRWQR